jgi:hypothetical protein
MTSAEFNKNIASQRMSTGMMCEAIVIADLYGRGYSVSKPFDGISKYDLIVDRNGELSKIQVKAASRHALQAAIGFTKFKINSAGMYEYYDDVKYGSLDFDFLAMVDRVSHIVYYVPMEDIDLTKKMVYIKANDKEKYKNF